MKTSKKKSNFLKKIAKISISLIGLFAAIITIYVFYKNDNPTQKDINQILSYDENRLNNEETIKNDRHEVNPFESTYLSSEEEINYWPTYSSNKDDSIENSPLLFSIGLHKNLYDWRVTDIVNSRTEVIYQTATRPHGFMYNQYNKELYFKMEGFLYSINWFKKNSLKKLNKIPYPSKNTGVYYLDTDFWIDSKTNNIRIAIMSEAKINVTENSTSVIDFSGKQYELVTEKDEYGYYSLERFKKKPSNVGKIYIGTNGTIGVVEIWEFNGAKWNFIDGLPTTFEACGTYGFDVLNFITNDRRKKIAFNQLKMDSQCAESMKCFDYENEDDLEIELAPYFVANKSFADSEYNNGVGHIEINSVHDLYFPIIRADIDFVYQSYPVIISANDLSQMIKLKWEFNHDLGSQLLISTFRHYILIQEEYAEGEIRALIFDSNMSSGESILRLKGSDIVFLPHDMAMEFRHSQE